MCFPLNLKEFTETAIESYKSNMMDGFQTYEGTNLVL